MVFDFGIVVSFLQMQFGLLEFAIWIIVICNLGFEVWNCEFGYLQFGVWSLILDLGIENLEFRIWNLPYAAFGSR